MDIDPTIAQTIVAKLKGAVEHEINLFDTRGIIIASTDHTRVGSVHEAAQLAIAQRKTINVDSTTQYAGARPGINAPVMIEDHVVAVVGITGNCAEVGHYGEIIRKMTEILIRENIDQHNRYDQRLMQANLIDALTRNTQDSVIITYLASALHIDLKQERVVVVGRFDEGMAPQEVRDAITQCVDQQLHYAAQSLWSAGAGRCIMLLDTQHIPDAAALCDDLIVAMAQQYPASALRFGIGTTCQSIHEYASSYELAARAVNWISFTHQHNVARYDDIGTGMLITALSDSDMHRIIDQALSNIPTDKIDEYRTILNAYSQCNGAITQAAAQCYIHKNTLQNKLNQIATLTGYNPRHLQDFTVLYTAFMLRDWMAFTSISLPNQQSLV